jgi:phage shock protein PspC (stress-responsive transcriptional regulator)
MNEITKIHLGRQPFTIAVDAYKDLQDYLTAIKRQVGKQNKDVLEEVELRMAELLQERGIDDTKVIVPEDVEYLKQQLGTPDDFKEETEARQEYEPVSEPSAPKRLYRDTEHAMFAGVAAGLAAYFRVDAVFIRILFVVAAISAGWGILIYILMWLIVPEARTPSERLQMRGKAVTVDSIKEVIDRADLKGAAERAGNTASKVVNPVLKGLGAVLGLVLATAGAAILLAELTIGTYLLAHSVLVNNQLVFPVGAEELFLTACIFIMTAILGLLLLLAGVALMRRKWSLPGWATTTLIALFFASVGTGTALAFDIRPQLENRIDRANQTYIEGECKENIFSHCSYWNNTSP